MKPTLKKALIYSFATVFFLSLLVLNVRYNSGSKLTLTTQALADDESANACCPWYILSSACIKRTESHQVTCGITTTYTYYSNSMHATVTGEAKDNGNGIQMVWGYSTSYVSISTTSTGAYTATLVNCPTDGKCYNCQEYRPCH